IPCLQETYQAQLKKRVIQHINERWGFDEEEKLRKATRFVFPEYERIFEEDLSISENTLIGRYLRKSLSLREDYSVFIRKLLSVLASFGLVKIINEKKIEYAQLDASGLIWCECDRQCPPIDPIYTARVKHRQYQEALRKANEYFRDFYQSGALYLKKFEAQPHSAQVKYEDRQEREQRFRNGELSCLFCSPTMELGIDIADLQLLHLRNVPPTPANYAQRSGRSGRRGEPALILTYCSAGSGHDQYFFRHRQEMVSGVVRPPRIDLSNEDLVRAHIHAIWLAHLNLSLGNSIFDLLEMALPGYPLKESLKAQLRLSPARFNECLSVAEKIIKSCNIDESSADWYSKDWLKNVLLRAPEEFDRALDRWRELYRAADQQWQEANEKLRYPIRDRLERVRLEAQRREAEHQKHLLCNFDTTIEESDFYPYRYFASEGFLPGYNFPRLPVRAYIPRGEGEFISRPRFLAISEFGPRNIIYHEGGKYEAGQVIIPPGGLESRCSTTKICMICGYYQSSITVDLCENCNSKLDASSCEIVSLLEMPNIKTWKGERISCDEEERRRLGYEITTHFRFAPAPGGQKRIHEALVYDESASAVLHLIYAPAAELFRINHGWRNRRERGFLINLRTGQWVSRVDEDEEEIPSLAAAEIKRVSLFVKDTHNILLVYFSPEIGLQDLNFQASLQYCLQRGIENVFQVEESEIASERIGSGNHRAILFYEASEGGVGVLGRLITEENIMAQIADAALERCHFDLTTFEDKKPECSHACFECLLSYSNQRDYPLLNRHLVKEFLMRLSKSYIEPIKKGRDYEEHYRWLRSLTDTRSELERKFIDHLYKTKRRLPDEAQKMLQDYYCIPDFFYSPNCCIFCDGSIHDEPEQKEKDNIMRQELRELGYRIVVIRYDQDLEEQIRKYSDIFGEGREWK
ncbi:MAG: helicase-related protein, partial [Candidatus Aminicenantes bacterium]|nr:helicase-related protein [Candidatus Aminicenantes bacterium]